MSGSEIARFRQQQTLQEEAARQGLYGVAAGFSRHDFIEARMQQGAEHILALFDSGNEEEAIELWNTEWALDERKQPACHTTTPC